MGVFGDTLRQARAHKGVTLKEAEQATRINRHHLLALEEEKFSDLPPLIYQRGFVRNYANYLHLDPNKVLAMFEQASGVPVDKTSPVPPQPLNMPNHWTPNFAVIAFLVVMSAVVFAWGFSWLRGDDGGTNSAPTEIIPTVTPMNSDTLFQITPTIFVPTATPTATPEPTVAVPPTKVRKPKATEVVGEPTIADAAEPTVATDGNADASMLSLNFYATGDIESLQIVADGVLVWDGPLYVDTKTGYLSAASFEIYVSQPDALLIIKEDGESFVMGEQLFSLP